MGDEFEPDPIFHGFGSDDDSFGAGFEELVDVFLGSDAAADLDVEIGGLDDVFDEIGLDGVAFLGAVEIDDVHPFGTGVGEGLGGVEGVDVIIELEGVVALFEADDLAVAEIDAGDDEHIFAQISSENIGEQIWLGNGTPRWPSPGVVGEGIRGGFDIG